MSANHATFGKYQERILTEGSRRDARYKLFALAFVVMAHVAAINQIATHFQNSPIEQHQPVRIEMQFITAPVTAPVKPTKPIVKPLNVPQPKPQPNIQQAPAPSATSESIPSETQPSIAEQQEDTSPTEESIAAPASTPEPVTVPAKFDADYLENPKPAYPATARRLRLQGTVILRVTVNENGEPEDVQIAESSGAVLLDSTAVKTVMKWHFVPAKRGDAAIRDVIHVPIRFSLTN